jgi:hypothetical protein
MTVPIPVPAPKPRSDLPRKFVLLFLLDGAAALGLVLLFRTWHQISYLAMLLLDSALLGLVNGLGARLLLKKRHWALRLLTVSAALILGLILLGLLTGWRYGLGSSDPKRFLLNWANLVQLLTGLAVAGLVLTAWRKSVSPARSAAEETPTQPAARVERPRRASRSRKPAVHTLFSGPRLSGGKRSQGKKKPAASGTRSRSRAKPAARSSVKAAARTGRPVRPAQHPKKKPAVLAAESKPRRRRRKPEVQVATAEEHRCPYCLEVVQPHDPRGIVECKVCHTLHHADCWAITGTCQVPHLNT